MRGKKVPASLHVFQLKKHETKAKFKDENSGCITERGEEEHGKIRIWWRQI